MSGSEQNTDQAQPIRRRIRRWLGVIVFLSLTAAMIVSIARYSLLRTSAIDDFATLESRRNDLRKTSIRLQTVRTQSDGDKRFIWQVLRQCRTADDIPDFQDEHIVSQTRGADGLTFYVPHGEHSLEISAAWYEPTKNKNVTTKGLDKPLGEKSWSVPLQNESGYIMKIQRTREGGPVTWTLQSNHAEFKPRTETVMTDVSGGGWSYSGSDMVVFPNQLQNIYRIADIEMAAAEPEGVQIFDVKLVGQQNQKGIEIRMSARIRSEGSATATSGMVASILAQQREDLLKPYEGNGKYELKRQSEPAVESQ